MRGKRSLQSNEIIPDMILWISHDVSMILSQALSDMIGDNITVPGGKWTVNKVEYLTDEEIQANTLFYNHISHVPTMIVNITKSDWENPQKIKDFGLIINNQGHIILAGNILVKDALRPYFENTQELIAINKHRKDCAACGQPLYIPVNNVHICKKCEEDLEDSLPF